MNDIITNSKALMGLEESHLESVGNRHFLHKSTVSDFLSMQKAAQSDGIDLQICSSFRSFDKQLSIWNRKWKGELPLFTLENKILDTQALSDIERIHAIMLWSALPGASRHHWGTDFDIFDKTSVERHNHKLMLVPKEYEHEGPCAALSQWINLNAQNFGFYLPYASYVGGVAIEPWHISHHDLAQKIQSHFNIDELHAVLKQADILGKQTILHHLPKLVKRYTFNQGNKHN